MELLVKYWDKMLIKVVGITYWSPTLKFNGNISTSVEPAGTHRNPGILINPTAESFMVWCFEDRYKKWMWKANEDTFKKQLADKDHKLDQEEFNKLEKEGTVENYTTACGGQQLFGGVTPKGRKRWKELKNLVRENREENADAIRELEDRVLVLVRKANNRDAMDEKKKGKGKKKKAPVVEEESDVDSDDEKF